MTELDGVLKRAVETGAAAGVVASAARRDGIYYSGAAGMRQIDGDAAMTTDTIFRIFSMTKAIAGVATAQLVERGQLDINTPVAEILPEFGELPVLEGFAGDTPILRMPKSQVTVRQLATHTSGLVYELWNADMQKYMKVTGRPNFLSGSKLGISYPLVFDPGERWDYGVGIDWLGLVIERVSGQRLDAYFQDEIFTPLGMSDTAFVCPPEKRGRLSGVHVRQENGALLPITFDLPSDPEIYCAGHGLYSTARDYMTFLLMMLNKGSYNGAEILKPSTLDFMLQNHIGDLEVTNLVTVNPAVTHDAEFFPGMSKKHSLATMINMASARGMRAAGSHCWAGALNTFFWFDLVNGIAGVVLMQSMPFCDPKCTDVLVDFEKAVYAQVMTTT